MKSLGLDLCFDPVQVTADCRSITDMAVPHTFQFCRIFLCLGQQYWVGSLNDFSLMFDTSQGRMSIGIIGINYNQLRRVYILESKHSAAYLFEF